MNVKQQYNCFPEFTYNTAFGSLLTGDIDRSKADNEQYSHKNILRQTCDCCTCSTQLCNNSAWNDDYNLQKQQSIQNIIKILVNFLGEFLLFLSSIIECEQFHSQCQLQKIVDTAEHIHQLRLTLLVQINNINGNLTNSNNLDIQSISFILHELASFIHCLSKEQQQIDTNMTHPRIIKFTQLLNRLEKTIKLCMDCINMNSNPPQCSPPSIPMMIPCINPPHIINNPTLTTQCLYSCNGFTTCMPWLNLQQMSEGNSDFGLMYGIKDENIRRKFGYGTRRHKSPKRTKQYKRSHSLNNEKNFVNNQRWTTTSTDDQIPVRQQTSGASDREKVKTIKQRDSTQQNEKISPNSIISQKKNTSDRLDSSHASSRLQSIVKSNRSSPLLRSNSEIDEPIELRSIHDHLMVSKTSGRMTPHTTSQKEELPITSTAGHSESKPTSHLNQQQESSIYEDDDDKSALWSPLSFQTYEYRTPSKTTFKISHESNQSLSPIHNGSINTEKSHESFRSRNISSKNDVKLDQSTSNTVQNDDRQSLIESINQNPNPSQIYVNKSKTANIDSSDMLTSHDKIKHNESISNKSIEQRLASPLSAKSVQRINSMHTKQNMPSSISNKELLINTTISDFMFDNYSEYQMSPSSSLFKLTNDEPYPLNVIEAPKSVEGVNKLINPPDINKGSISPSNLSPITTYSQRSVSAISGSEDSPLFPTTKKTRNS